MTSPSPTYIELLQELLGLLARSPRPIQISAAMAGLTDLDPNVIVLTQMSFREDGIETEINLTTNEACPPYHWRAEITVRDTPLEHYLLTTDGEILEAYGRRTSPITPKRLELLRARLRQF